MTKTEILRLLNLTQAQLARLLGLSRAAVAQWDADKPIPEKQEMRLRYKLRPDAFPTEAEQQPCQAVGA